MGNLDIETWALARAHHIVLNEGLNLAKAAQDLDRKRSRSLVYELRKVIAVAILEAHAASSKNDAMPQG
jgi:hypothetical protein